MDLMYAPGILAASTTNAVSGCRRRETLQPLQQMQHHYRRTQMKDLSEKNMLDYGGAIAFIIMLPPRVGQRQVHTYSNSTLLSS